MSVWSANKLYFIKVEIIRNDSIIYYESTITVALLKVLSIFFHYLLHFPCKVILPHSKNSSVLDLLNKLIQACLMIGTAQKDNVALVMTLNASLA